MTARIKLYEGKAGPEMLAEAKSLNIKHVYIDVFYTSVNLLVGALFLIFL